MKTYRVSTGKDNSTPIGTFKIVSKLVNPVWYSQGAIVPPESPENVLGTRWLSLTRLDVATMTPASCSYVAGGGWACSSRPTAG